ncbi:MAG: NTP transferase domain-containing protein [Firmicutes bacterium]|nr:NTP transferase domain-containing protein [Bacillota bacterium]
MKVIIMAGGEGTRLRPLTCDRPKPMVPIMNRPIMEHIVNLLKQHGLTEIGVTLQYLPEAIKSYFGDGGEFGVQMRYFVEEVPLGTAGSVKNAEAFLDDTFLVISGDALTDLDLSAAIAFHREKKSIATIVLTVVDSPLEYGVVITEQQGRITQFLEKPSWGEVFSDQVNTGIYILEPEVLTYFKAGQNFDFSKDLFPLLLKHNQPLYGCVVPGYWCDVGNLQQYQQAHTDILAGRVKVNIPGRCVGDQIWVGPGSEIHPTASLRGPLLIGDNCQIGPDVVIEPYSVLGNNTVVEARASVKRSILWDSNYIGKKAELRGATLGNRVKVKPNSFIFEGAVIGDDTVINSQSIIKPNVKIWPAKVIDQGTVVNDSLVWGTRCARSLFGANGVTGQINLEITPEFMTKLGAAYGTWLGNSARVAVSADAYGASQMLKKALIAGILSTGVTVFDLGKATTPVCRFSVRSLEVKGGIHVKIAPNDLDKIILTFINSQGADISKGDERKIEGLFTREEFRRIASQEVAEATNLPQLNETYLENLRASVNQAGIKNEGFKLLLDYDPENMSRLVPTLLSELGCSVTRFELPGNSGPGRPRNFADIVKQLPQLAETVKRKGADLGVVMDNNGEQLILIDEKGQVISDELFTALVSLIILKSRVGGTVAVPVTAPRVIEQMARQYDGRVVRTKVGPQSFMEKVLSQDIVAIQGEFSQFQLHFDALAALIKIMEYLSQNGIRLSELREAIPQFHLSQKAIDCPWEAKGRVMRTLIEEKQGEKVELLEGIKVYHDEGWALVLPDADEPLCRVYSEGFSQEIADSLTEMYAGRINEIARGQEQTVE